MVARHQRGDSVQSGGSKDCLLLLPGKEDPLALAEHSMRKPGNHWDLWNARCVETRTAGAGGGPGKPTDGNVGMAPRADPHLIATDRVHADEPYYSQKHKQHGMNVQVIARPDGTPLWFSRATPGRTHDLAAARAHGIVQACLTRQILILANRARTESTIPPRTSPGQLDNHASRKSPNPT